MERNVGGTDRLERVVHGVVFLLLAVFLVGGVWRWVLGAYGLLRLATGAFAFCPAYLPFGHRTCSFAARPGQPPQGRGASPVEGARELGEDRHPS